MNNEQNAKRDWLNRALIAEKKLKALARKCKVDREMTQRITANFEVVDKGKSDTHINATEKAIMKMLGSDEEYAIYFAEYLAFRREIQQAIDSIDAPEIEAILIDKHLNGYTFSMIATKNHYCKRTVQNYYKEGLDRISADFLKECT